MNGREVGCGRRSGCFEAVVAAVVEVLTSATLHPQMDSCPTVARLLRVTVAGNRPGNCLVKMAYLKEIQAIPKRPKMLVTEHPALPFTQEIAGSSPAGGIS